MQPVPMKNIFDNGVGKRVIRLIRGKEFYKIKFFQTKKKRRMDYYWSLLFDKNSVKESRIGKDFGGKALSGREWQKLALARAIFKSVRTKS